MDAAKHDELLCLADTEAIRLTGRDGAVMIGNVAMPPDATIDLRQERSVSTVSVVRSAPSCCRENRLILVSDDKPATVRSPRLRCGCMNAASAARCGSSLAISPSSRW